MPSIKTKTIGGNTYELKRYPTDIRGKQFEYYVTEDGRQIDDPVYTRADAMQRWRETINAIRRADSEETTGRQLPNIPAFMGDDGYDPDIPDF